MGEETNATEWGDSASETNGDVQETPSRETAIPPWGNPIPSADTEVEVEIVAISQTEELSADAGGPGPQQPSMVQRYGAWAGLLGGAILIGAVVLLLRSRRHQITEPTTSPRDSFWRTASSRVPTVTVPQSLRQRIPGPWNQGDIEVIDTPTERRITVHLPWGRSTAEQDAQQEAELSRWQTVTARFPRRSSMG